MAITHCQHVFDQLPGRFNPQGAGEWRARIQFHIAGDRGGDWAVLIEDGRCTVSPGTIQDPTATVSTTDETYLGMATGAVNPMAALTAGKVKIQGNISDIMKLNNPDIFRRPVQ